MNGRRRSAVTVVVALAAVVAFLVPGGAAVAQPNPYGQTTHRAVVTLDDRGGYRVVETFDQNLVREYRLGLGGTIPDGVRLAGGRPTDLPGILRPGFGPITATLDGSDVAVDVRRAGHAATVDVGLEQAAAGRHHAEFRYTRTAATVKVDGSTSTYVQTLGSGTIDLSADGGIESVRCVTFAPVSQPCGTPAADGWQVTRDDQPDLHVERSVPLTLIVTSKTGAADPAPPVIDRH